ncbi:TPA_asm: restriction endonuclease subunit S [Salmonella enterica subsp. houtenae serovar 16:z4,z32:-]|uniref:Restriction endonuclease subunit S n=1 Tax=Salmonella enterica subsp. houtenae serovar 16:z4,z32:- TaxID=1307497 RepID=A0A735KTW1_SALHO|nr:restriction endonuclease subunit S [Salmonella enterica]ECE6506136.1 restriction endonuclease subunit S [Salmonella enterica subsp. houtenae]EDS7538975.1 restriction endonuclease subunit S [Salmonella enterica subsp. enterica]EGI6407770.1 restriction endonuclease subunit S [Salmonella enterica subsp. houtenae serovar 16:z4,z32:-]ENZ84135.1 Type I restriction-modification system [Salmonella enterica subsp. houtenae serovar 16:z4,z32:-- str. RKS3027]QGF85087.1 restriction endonuclease subunit
MAVEKLIVDHIDTWTTALQTRSTAGRGSSGKIDLYGIKKLRELILELAVRGKLVPQDPNDEPASVLLERIAAEKAELVKQGKIKKPKPLPEISEEEKPFELPAGWEWVRFGSIYEMEYGNNLPQEKRSNSGEYNVYGSNGIVGTHNEACIKSPCIVIGRKGSAGALNLSDQAACWVTDVAYSTIPPSAMDLEFVFIQFHTLGLDTLGKGIKPGLNRNDAYNLTIAIPPQSEQKAIVSKVNELMTLCDQLEQHSLTSLDAHQQLVETLLTTLTDSQNADELAENWARISEYFDTLFTTEASIDALKQTILQLAVMGKITTPKISSLTKNKNTTEQNNSIFSDLMQYIPAHWNVCTLDQISAAIIDCPHSTPKWTEQGFICVRTNQFKPGHLDLNNSRYVSEQTYIERTQRLEPSYGDILYSREGGILGVACRVPEKVKICLGQRMMLIRPKVNISSEYLEIVLNSPLITSLAQQMTTGGAAPRINVSTIKGYPIPCPPIEEQNEIIEKINELNGVCEQLRSRIQSAQQTQLHLADALTDAAIN